ncbi:Hypothetical protein I595_3080 [Croceitalea dokdonensis DOKDO 023]|uniref:Uncharacterized protein n=1 Tax=Croceitalea dokdonensis DOKDO 023 TaxID=1300341 RepID=A0A0P7AGI9_9FLAO|nr:Hypothetical protein I595_3080 [Croceitalea dokdonensis DOKDO 023]
MIDRMWRRWVSKHFVSHTAKTTFVLLKVETRNQDANSLGRNH